MDNPSTQETCTVNSRLSQLRFIPLPSESRGCSPFQRKHKDKRHISPCNMALGIFIQKYITKTLVSRNCTSLCYGRPQDTWKQKYLYWKTCSIEKLLMVMKCLSHASLTLDQLDSLPQFLVSCLFCFVFLKSIHQSPTSAKHCAWPWKTNICRHVTSSLLSSILFCSSFQACAQVHTLIFRKLGFLE